VAEKISALEATRFLREHAERGNLDARRAIPDRVPDAPPVPGDEMTAS